MNFKNMHPWNQTKHYQTLFIILLYFIKLTILPQLLLVSTLFLNLRQSKETVVQRKEPKKEEDEEVKEEEGGQDSPETSSTPDADSKVSFLFYIL